MIRVNHILNNCGLSCMRLTQQTLHSNQCTLIIHNRLDDIAMYKWYYDIYMCVSSMCSGYKMFKNSRV